MENVVVSIVGLFGVCIGALITYGFNSLTEKEKLRNSAYMHIYEQLIKNIDRTAKSAKEIKMLKISNDIERQYKHPVNYADVLEEINSSVNKKITSIRVKINDLIDFNLFLSYHKIPLKEYEELINSINRQSFKIIELIEHQQKLYNSMVSSIGYINVKNKTWTCILKNEKDIEKNTEEYIKNIVNFSDKIQSDYYSDLLKIK